MQPHFSQVCDPTPNLVVFFLLQIFGRSNKVSVLGGSYKNRSNKVVGFEQRAKYAVARTSVEFSFVNYLWDCFNAYKNKDMERLELKDLGYRNFHFLYYCLIELYWQSMCLTQHFRSFKTKSIKHSTKEPKRIFFFLFLLFESCPIFQQDKKGHKHNIERFLCCSFLFCLHFLTTDTPPLTRWPFSMVSWASHTTNTTNRRARTHIRSYSN